MTADESRTSEKTGMLGRIIYKEKGLLYKLMCAGIIITGLVIGSL